MPSFRIWAPALLLLCPQIQAQLNSGTVGVLIASEGKAVYAVDSRLTKSTGEIRDDICKLATSHQKFVFMMAGMRGDDFHWDALAAARTIAGEILNEPVKAGALDRIIGRWTESATAWLNSVPVELISQAVSIIGDNRLIDGIFTLALPDGSLDHRRVTITAAMRLNRLVFDHSTSKFPGAVFEVVIGRSKIANQRLGDPSSSFWAAENKAKALVEITIDELPNSDVGGPVNSLELTGNGIKWLTHNKWCGE